MISSTARIYPHVEIAEGCEVEDYSVIGAPLSYDERFPRTVIGTGAVIRSHTVIYSGCTIRSKFSTGNKANIREFTNIGDGVSIGTLTVVEHHVTIEEEVRIHSQAFIPEFCVLKRGSWIGPNVVLTNAKYPRTSTTKDELSGVVVGEEARIGANSTVLPGVKIGRNSLVGAGSLVTSDTVQQGIYYGNPAALRGWLCICGRPLEEEGGRLFCLHCSKGYKPEEGRIFPE
ncbi:MAG: DapH/DapD/GlmU-related protein [Thermoplasmatota archaeon]